MRDPRKQFGDEGERAAERYLRSKGYRIIERNARLRCGEIDLVCRLGREVVFVEVKTRSGKGYGAPEESVTRAKQHRLIRASEEYLAHVPYLRSHPWRIDVIAITTGSGEPEIVHIPNAVAGED
ncbi:MAG: YraN family protein [bacterium]|nr:YraN family protein [bacterium]